MARDGLDLSYFESRREREIVVFCQLNPSRGIMRSSIKRQQVVPSARRFYLSRPLMAFLSITCRLLIQGLQES